MWNDVWNCITSDVNTHEERVDEIMNSNLDLNIDQAEELVCTIESCME